MANTIQATIIHDATNDLYYFFLEGTRTRATELEPGYWQVTSRPECTKLANVGGTVTDLISYMDWWEDRIARLGSISEARNWSLLTGGIVHPSPL